MMLINPLILSSPSIHARRNEIVSIMARLMIQLYANELVKYPANVTPAANATRESRKLKFILNLKILWTMSACRITEIVCADKLA